jgi:RNA polymerase sigma-70 factor (ECF subfamily)
MTATLIKLFGFQHIETVEDVVQETFIAAYEHWAEKLPESPAAWLMQVAKNKALNAIKRDSRLVYQSESAFVQDKSLVIDDIVNYVFSEQEIKDSQLKLLFLCCHPQLPEKSQVILTLHTLSSFSTEEIANALMMQSEAVKKTLFRTKKFLKENGLFANTNYIYQSSERINTILQVMYLMFNEGYKTTKKKGLIDKDLCFEAIRLCKLLLEINEAEQGEINALLALMFFNISRFPARMDENGEIVLLQDQDRKLWNEALIDEGFCYLNASRQGNSLSRYHIEAGISSLHCMAKTFEETDWNRIVAYYDILLQYYNTPIAAIHRSVAVSYAQNEYAGLAELEKIEHDTISEHYLFYATKAELYYRAKEYREALPYYEQALDLAKSPAERKHLQNRIASCARQLN